MNNARRNSIKTLTRIYYDYQRERMSLDGRLGITKDGSKKKRAPVRDMVILVAIKKRRDDVLGMEEATAKLIAPEVHMHPLWKSFLSQVKGIGEIRAAVQISEFDWTIASTVSKAWQFAGLNPDMVLGKKVVRGKIVVTTTRIRGDRKTKGFLCPFNQFLRADLCGRLATSFLMCTSPYTGHYYNMRSRLEAEDWGEPAKNPTDKNKPKAFHQHNAARRYMIKMYIRDLYVAGRTVEGLPVREPYQEEYLGKKHDEE